MADITLKKIEEVLDKKLNPINKKLDEHDQQFRNIATKLDEHSTKLDSLTLDMIDVQKKTDILPDLYSIVKGTKEIADDHEQRIQNLETAA